MGYPFGGIALGTLGKVLAEHFGIEDRTTADRVDTQDGPQFQPFWFNPENNQTVEAPSGSGDHRVTVERVKHIARRLGVEYPQLLGLCMTGENEMDAATPQVVEKSGPEVV